MLIAMRAGLRLNIPTTPVASLILFVPIAAAVARLNASDQVISGNHAESNPRSSASLANAKVSSRDRLSRNIPIRFKPGRVGWESAKSRLSLWRADAGALLIPYLISTAFLGSDN